MENNNIVEIVSKYFDIGDIINIILDMVNEPYNEKKESLLTYFSRKLKNMYIIGKPNDKLYQFETGYECHEYLLLSPLEKYINDNFSNIYCYSEPIDSNTNLIIMIKN